VTGEWLGGPGVYAVYASYGLTDAQIQNLYVLGFFCSSVFGLCVGNFADRIGRKRAAMLYCIAGIVACACKHVPYAPVLVIGRFFDGMHSSLLYTSFETWLVSEHLQRHAFPKELLGYSFAMSFSLSYFSAILCGLVAQRIRDFIPDSGTFPIAWGGWKAPYELAALVQLLGLIYIGMQWPENYGTLSTGDTPRDARTRLCDELKKVQILVCGIVVTCFESTMFIFVISWTPALAPNGDKTQIPCGIIFSCYMMASLSGASVYSLVKGYFTQSMMVLVVLAVATVAMLIPAVCGVTDETAGLNFFAFLLFEVAVGIYFPAVGAWKSTIVQERHRSTIYSIFRTPMNLIVAVVLLLKLEKTTIFQVVAFNLFVATVVVALFRDRDTPKDEPLLQSAWVRSVTPNFDP